MTHIAARFLIVRGCAGAILFALEMSKPEPKDGFCNIHTAECYDQLGRR